jgi:transketolase
MRALFAKLLHEEMARNQNIFLLTADLGYKMWDKVRDDFPTRFVNTGAAEQAMLDMSVGLALEGKIPVVYSITPFLLYRGFETIRTYIDHETIPVKLVGGGRDDDYEHDGFSHWAFDDRQIMSVFKNIDMLHPTTKEEVMELFPSVIYGIRPTYLNLTRKI